MQSKCIEELPIGVYLEVSTSVFIQWDSVQGIVYRIATPVLKEETVFLQDNLKWAK